MVFIFIFFIYSSFFIKISNLALPGVMLKYERGQYRKKKIRKVCLIGFFTSQSTIFQSCRDGPSRSELVSGFHYALTPANVD